MDEPWNKKEEYKPEQTVFTAFHSEIARTGTKMCTDHKWRKAGENELACTLCPTQIICAIDDERLLVV